MSRSYRKNLVDKYCYRGAKAFANRKVRRWKGPISNGNAYRKIYPQWDIRDYWYRWDKRDLREYANDDWWWNYKYQKDAPGYSNDEELWRVCWRLWRK